MSEIYGGGQVYISNLVMELYARQYNVSYLSLTYKNIKEPQLEKWKTRGVEEIQLLLPSEWQKQNPFFLEPSIIELLTKIFLDINPDIIHAHAWKDFGAKAARQAGHPLVVTTHHGGIVCPAGTLLNAEDEICRIPASDDNCLQCCSKAVPGWRLWFPLIKALPLKFRLWLGMRLRRLPLIMFLTPLGTISCNIRDKMKEVFYIGQNASRIIAPSTAIADALVRNGIPEQKIVIVPHGIPLPQRQPLRPDFGKGPMRFIFVGRISHVKGVHVMLEAFAGLSPETYELHIVGGAGTKLERRYLAKLQQQYASVNTIWHGAKSHDEIPQYLASCDVMLHPAIFLEVFGLTIAEALAVGRPVIATRCGGAEEQISDEENGFLVPPNNPAALANKIEHLLNEPSEIMRLAFNIQQVMSMEKHVNALSKIYDGLL